MPGMSSRDGDAQAITAGRAGSRRSRAEEPPSDALKQLIGDARALVPDGNARLCRRPLGPDRHPRPLDLNLIAVSTRFTMTVSDVLGIAEE